jgi:hypothetical protein
MDEQPHHKKKLHFQEPLHLWQSVHWSHWLSHLHRDIGTNQTPQARKSVIKCPVETKHSIKIDGVEVY